MTCEPHPSCHRCYAGIAEYLRTDLPSAPKSMKIRREELSMRLLVPVCAQKIEEIESPGLRVYPPTRDIRRGFSAQNGQYLVLQTFTAF